MRNLSFAVALGGALAAATSHATVSLGQNPAATDPAPDRQQRLADSEADGQADVDLRDAASLGEALEAISRASGVAFDHEADPSQPIEPPESPLRFWHALDLVLDQAELDVDFYGGDDDQTLRLVRRHPRRPSRVDSAAYSGVYRIEPQSVTARRVLHRPGLSGLNVSVQIAWETRLTPIGLTLPIDQLSGRLDNGAPLGPQASGQTIDVATNPAIAFSEVVLPMQLPAGQPTQIDRLSGVLRALLPGQPHTFELPLADSGAAETVAAMTVRLEDIRRNDDLHEVRLGIQLDDAGRALESHRQWIFENEVFVQRADETRVDHLGYQVYRQTPSGVGVGYLFDLGADFHDAAIHYRSPTAVVRSEVPFILREIPLP